MTSRWPMSREANCDVPPCSLWPSIEGHEAVAASSPRKGMKCHNVSVLTAIDVSKQD